MSNTENKNSPFKSSFGFHPCNYGTYSRLKSLHKWYWQTVYDFHQEHRILRKLPENRKTQPPVVCPLFVANEIWYKPFERKGVSGFKIYPKKLIDHDILALYSKSRIPSSEPVVPWDDQVISEIQSLYESVSKFWREKKVKG